jgi:hypothetical protein
LPRATTRQADGERSRDPVVDAYVAHVDRSLIRKNLKLTVEERFLQLMELQRFAAELRRAGARASRA